MNITKCLKTSSVFIGTLIGAGFATGREILLFFGRSTPFIPILSAVICGGFCYLFLYAGNKGLNVIPSKGGKLMLGAFFIAAFIIYAAMISAADNILYRLVGSYGGGVLTAIIIGIICLSIKDGLKFLNLIVVPLLLILIILISSKLSMPSFPSKFNIQNAFAYAALNMFLGGFLIVPDGRAMKRSEMILTSIISIAVLVTTLMLIYKVVLHSEHATMPVMEVAITLRMQFVASIIILLAIISTMAGCFTALSAITMTVLKNKWVSGIAVATKGIMTAIIGFRLIVDIGYPLVSIVGVIYTISVIAIVIKGNNNREILLLKGG